MNFMVGYFSRRKAFHIVEWLETYDEVIEWLGEKINVRKDFVIFQRVAQQLGAVDVAARRGFCVNHQTIYDVQLGCPACPPCN